MDDMQVNQNFHQLSHEHEVKTTDTSKPKKPLSAFLIFENKVRIDFTSKVVVT